MDDISFIEKSDKILEDLLNLASDEFESKGIRIEPSVIVAKIIRPLKDLYVRNVTELLESHLQNIS